MKSKIDQNHNDVIGLILQDKENKPHVHQTEGSYLDLEKQEVFTGHVFH